MARTENFRICTSLLPVRGSAERAHLYANELIVNTGGRVFNSLVRKYSDQYLQVLHVDTLQQVALAFEHLVINPAKLPICGTFGDYM